MLDLFAYNEDAYGMWLNNVSNVANSNAKKGIQNLNLKNQSRTQSRPASSHSIRHSRATVAPSDNLTNDEGLTMLSVVNSELSTGAGEANFARGMAGAKVNTAWATTRSSSSTDGGKESESTRADASYRHPLLLSRSFSAPPEEQLPLTTSTPLTQQSHTTSQYQQQRLQPKGGLLTYTSQDEADSDVI